MITRFAQAQIAAAPLRVELAHHLARGRRSVQVGIADVLEWMDTTQALAAEIDARDARIRELERAPR